MGRYFGTDGFRGEANVGLTAQHAYKIGRFLGWYFKNNSRTRIVIGKDTRRSCYMIEAMLTGGIVASGADVYLMHVTTTPSVAYITKNDGFDCGIMITASHNPYYDNGIKIINGNGEKMPEEVLNLCEDYIDNQLDDIPYAKRDQIGQTIDYSSGRDRYVEYLKSLAKFSFKGLNIALDCANGTTSNIAKSLFESLGANTLVINATPNGLNINENAGSTHIENLQKIVLEKKLDAGFAFDGDADRCLAVDDEGTVITGDHILYIYGCYLKEKGELDTNTVVATVMSNFGFFKALEEKGILAAKTKVGDKYVHDYMAQHGCLIGGEQSGHIIFAKYASTGDGLLTAIKVLEVILEKNKKLSELASPMKVYPQVLVNVRVTDKVAAISDEEVQKAIEVVSGRLGDSGRILVRESGTEPLVRVMVEADSEDKCNRYVDEVVNVIKKRGYTV